MLQIAFILHGKIKHRQKLQTTIAGVFGNNYQLSFNSTEYTFHACSLAARAVQNGATHIICVGGDGSLNEVINGVLLNGASHNVKVGLLPHGTGNDFARTMQVTENIEQLKQLIDKDSFRTIDVGYTEFTSPDGKPATRYFINISDVGIGGAIAQKLATASKFWGPTLTYQKGVLSTLATYKNQPLTIQTENFIAEQPAMSLIVANGRFFGGGMGIAPHALPDDKKFGLVLIGQVSTWEYLMNLGNIKKSKQINHPQIKYLEAESIDIRSAAGPLPIDMDGEFIGFTPVKMKVIPGAITFIAPQ